MGNQFTSGRQQATAQQVLKEYWGYDSFRPLQEDIIDHVMTGNDTLALLPTGGGKSLCYQVPAMMKEGLCLVISPLIALMKDQVENLRKRNITAFAVFSGMSRKEVINIFKVASESNCKFLYVSPERLETGLFKEYLPGLQVNLIAVDEAHCISQWGYDFRPSYLRIASLREELHGVPVLALTASATPEVQEDICNKLEFGIHRIFRQSFERPNLSYSIFNVDSRINKVLDILRSVQGSSIIYCKSRKRTMEFCNLLRLQGLAANFYHAGLPQEERNKRQEDWIKNKTRVIVCTNAFGMGIDKPDVRTVIHADVPESLEHYYQEAGRAGRDGKQSYAVLLYNEQDLADLEQTAAARFPSLDEIRKIYQAVANYLQLPAGSGEGRYFDFDISDFLKKFSLEGYTALYSLKALEQDGWLAFNEQVFLPSSVVFTTGKEFLYEFEKSNPLLEPVIKSLLRAYGGIFDHPSHISEKVLGGLLKKEPDEVKKQLLQLHQAGIIEYVPQKDTPQLLLLRPRIKTEDLSIDIAGYNKRKEQFTKRMGQMLLYVKEKTQCRSVMIGRYFGDDKMKPCGACDNCLKMKTTALTKDEFDVICHRIINIVKYEPLSARELLLKLGDVKKEHAWAILAFLQAENKIVMTSHGTVMLK